MSAPDRPTDSRHPPLPQTISRAGDWRRLGAAALMALVLLAGLGAGATGPTAKAPEEAFDLFKKAVADGNQRAAAAVLSPEQIDRTVATLIQAELLLVQIDTFKSDKTGAARKSAQTGLAVLARHGVTADDLRKGPARPKADFADPKFDFKKYQEEQKKYFAAQLKYAGTLAAKVKDKVGLLVDLEDTGKKLRKDDERARKWDQEYKASFRAATLKGLKVNGDRATATFVFNVRGSGKERVREEPIAFRKIGGNWRIDRVGRD
jgi:hypothetical protein